LNIVVLSERFWPEGSGGELATYLYIKELQRHKDLYFKVLTGTPLNKIPVDVRGSKKIDFVVLDFLRAKHRVTLWKNLSRNIVKIMSYLKDAEILYIPGSSVIIAPYVKKHYRDIKIIYHLHGYLPISYNSAVYYPYEKRKNRIYLDTCKYAARACIKHFIACLLLHHYLTRKARKSLEYVDRIICVSKRQEYIINDAIPFTRGKTTIIYNPPPPDVIGIKKNPSNKPLLLFTGGDNPVKGIDKVIKTAEYLHKQGIDYRLVITNKVNKKLIEKTKNKPFGKHIEFTGRIARQKILELYSRAWILLFPSIYEEPLPYTVMEALLTGTMPISFPVGGVPELVEGTISYKLIPSILSIDIFISKVKQAIETLSNDLSILSTFKKEVEQRFSYKLIINKMYKEMTKD